MEQKISKYSTATIVSLLCLLFSLPLQAQQQRPGARPAVKQKAKEEIKAGYDSLLQWNVCRCGLIRIGQ